MDPATVFERNALRDRMMAAGAITAGEAAHHIVPGGGPQNGGRDATSAQDKLAQLGIDLNGTDNGVGLSPGFHNRVHTSDYYRYVNEQLSRVSTRQDAAERLAQIGERLKAADQRYQDAGILPIWNQ